MYNFDEFCFSDYDENDLSRENGELEKVLPFDTIGRSVLTKIIKEGSIETIRIF